MAVRLRLKIVVDEKATETVALLNSGYEAPTPQLLIPISLAAKLKLWPPIEASEVILDTAGGPLRAWFYPMKAKVSMIAEDVHGRGATADVVVSSLADEPLINDKLADELEIAVGSFGRGRWRFTREPKEKLRRSERIIQMPISNEGS
ncbi:MAG: hypothetical protein QXD66_00745 [Candidatus Nezhaarchaeales archaeon]